MSTRRNLIVIAALATCLPAAEAGAQGSFTVRGRVYDFLHSHPDFGLTSGEVLATTAGLVELELDSSGAPTLSGVGARVTTGATDEMGRPIAMHLAKDWQDINSVAYVLEHSPSYRNGPTIDGYDPEAGPYGGANVGPAPDPTHLAELPTIEVPSPGSNIGNLTISKDSAYQLTSDLWVDDLTFTQQTGVTVYGNRIVRVDGDWLIRNNCTIDLADDDATLDIFVAGGITFDNHVQIGMGSTDHSRIRIWYTGTAEIDWGNNVDVYCSLIAPDATLYMHNSATVYGTIAASGVRTRNGGVSIHLAGPGWGGSELCYWPDDNKGATGTDSGGSITDASTFATWFNETPGLNASKFMRFAFIQQADGSYSMSKPGFDPAAGDLYGNEGMPNNGNYTCRVDAQFFYDSCGGQFFEATTDGELWVYVNGQLAIDLSGNVSGATQYVDFDRFELLDGKMYDLQIFFASRTGDAPDLGFRTNAVMFSTYDVETPVTYLGD